MTQVIFDGGIFSIFLIIGFTCVAFYRKIGALMLVVPVVVFLIAGLVIVTGEDVAFYKSENPTNMTTVMKNSSASYTITTTMTKLTASNETDYLVGNGQFPITGTGQLVLGYSLILLAIIMAIIFAAQTIKGNLIKGD